MSETLQIVTAILSFLSASLVAILAFMTYKLNHKQGVQGEQLTVVGEKVVKIEKQTDGMATQISEARLLQGLAQGGLEERNRADDKATALAESKPLGGEVTAIIDQYKAGELKADIALVPEKVVDEQERRETQP